MANIHQRRRARIARIRAEEAAASAPKPTITEKVKKTLGSSRKKKTKKTD